MNRCAFIAAVGGAASWPLVARGQQSERVRRIGVLMPMAADDKEGQRRIAAFHQGLLQLGWTEGRNVRIDARWGVRNTDDARRHSAELLALAPDVILATGSAATGSVLQATSAPPIVFVTVVDPVGAGFVDSLARPGGNTTGFTLFEYATSAKWLELLKEIAPRTTRAAVLRDPTIASGSGQLGAIQSVAQSLGVELIPLGMRDAGEIDRVIAAFAGSSNGGLIVAASPTATIHSDLIITLAARYELPAVYYQRLFVTGGGLISYGPDFVDQYRRAAAYVDRILKGEKPADLPCKRQPSTRWRSILKPPRHCTSTCRTPCSPAPTRSSNEKARVHNRARFSGPRVVYASTCRTKANRTIPSTKSIRPRPSRSRPEVRNDRPGRSGGRSRRTARSTARRLAEIGVSTNHIAAITGHASLAEVERYTKAANRKRMAREAMMKLIESEQ